MPAVGVNVGDAAVKVCEYFFDGFASPFFEIVHGGHMEGVDAFRDDFSRQPLGEVAAGTAGD